MNRKRQILRQRGSEIAQAAALFGEALFTRDPGKFFEDKGAELERELGRRGVIDVEGHAVDEGKNK